MEPACDLQLVACSLRLLTGLLYLAVPAKQNRSIPKKGEHVHMSDTEKRNEELVKSFFEVLSAGYLETLRSMFTVEACWTAMSKNIPGAGAHPGRDHIIDEFLAPVRGMFVDGDPKVQIHKLTAKDNMVYAETRAVGMFQSGIEYDNLYCWAFEITDGQVDQVREYMDSHYIMSVVPG